MGRPWLWVGVVVGIVAIGSAAFVFLAPKGTTTLDETAPEGLVVRRGAFQDGEPLHHAEGTVQLLRVGEGHVLRFEDYDATAGPDVYYYFTPSARASTSQEVESDGIRVDTKAAMGQATLRGDFNVDLPARFDPALYEGLAVWCERYNVLFGFASLEDSSP